MINNETVLASRYAQAFFNEFGSFFMPEHLTALMHARSYFQQHTSICSLLKIPLIDDEIKIRALDTILIDQYHLPAQIEQLIRLLVHTKRAFLIVQVLRQLHVLYQIKAGIEVFKITSTTELTDEQKRTLIIFLQNKTGHTIQYEYKIDPSLIAGIRMMSDTHLWEYSVAQQLSHAEHEMKKILG